MKVFAVLAMVAAIVFLGQYLANRITRIPPITSDNSASSGTSGSKLQAEAPLQLYEKVTQPRFVFN